MQLVLGTNNLAPSQTSMYMQICDTQANMAISSNFRVKRYNTSFAATYSSPTDSAPSTTLYYFTGDCTGMQLVGDLTCSMNYYFVGWLYRSGIWRRTSSAYFGTASCQQQQLATPSLIQIGSTTSTIFVEVSIVPNANYYTIALDTGHSYSGQAHYHQFEDLTSSKTYGVTWKAQDTNHIYLDSTYYHLDDNQGYFYIATEGLSPTPSNLTGLYIEDVYATNITARWNASLNTKDYRIYLARGSTVIVENTYATPTSYIFWNSTFNLQRGSQHTLTVTPRNIDNVLGTGQTIYFTPLTSTKPSPWSWTTTELNALNNQGAFNTITATRWNSFLDKVQEFINYYNTKYGTGVYSVISGTSSSQTGNRNCKVSVSPPGILTANDFNHIRFCIGSMNSTGLNDFSAGQPVMGSYITTITTSLNGVD